MLKLAEEQLESSQARQKKYFDMKTKVRRFSPGDMMLVLLSTDTNKLLVLRNGPKDISNTKGPINYKVEINGKKKTMHANLLKKYLSREEETSSTVPGVFSQTQDYLKEERATADGSYARVIRIACGCREEKGRE